MGSPFFYVQSFFLLLILLLLLNLTFLPFIYKQLFFLFPNLFPLLFPLPFYFFFKRLQINFSPPYHQKIKGKTPIWKSLIFLLLFFYERKKNSIMDFWLCKFIFLWEKNMGENIIRESFLTDFVAKGKRIWEALFFLLVNLIIEL